MTEATGNRGGDSPSRLDRIEALLERSIQQHDREMAEIRAITASNARSIAAWENRFTEIEEETQETTSSNRSDLSERIERQSEEIEGLRRQSEDDWTRFDQRHEEHAQRFNTLLEEARADRQEWRQKFDEVMAQIKSILQRMGGSES